jgi:hypothetical protein
VLIGLDGGVDVTVLDVVKHLVLKLLPIQTTMTLELLLLFDCVDCVLSVLYIKSEEEKMKID